MKISSKAIYAFRALFDIAFHNAGQPTKVESIATREEVPPRFLEQIFQDLKAAKLVGSKRGPTGGYFLLRAADAISMGDIIRAVEGQADHSCCDGEEGSALEECSKSSKCVTAAVWQEVTVKIDSILDGVTLSDICLKGEELGVKREADAQFSFTI